MPDELKSREQLMVELNQLRQEVERLRTEGGCRPAPGGLAAEELDRRLTEHMGWY